MVCVSIVSSVRNEREHLEPAIRSILGQSFQEWEWVIVDDASTDGTTQILAEWAKRDSRFKIIYNETRQGLSRALNRAVNVSGGRYLARMDADDLCHPMRLARQIRYLDEHPKVGLVGSYNHVIDEEGRLVETWRFQHKPEEIYYTLQFQNCLCHSSVMFRRDLFCELEGYREHLSVAQDYDLWLRMSHKVAMYKIPEPLVNWRKRSRGISLAKKEEQSDMVHTVTLKNLKDLAGQAVPLSYLLVILGNKPGLPVGEHEAFIVLLKRIQERIFYLAPLGVNRKRLDALCRDRVRILRMGLLWSSGRGDRFFRALPLLLRHIRLTVPFVYYLRTRHWSLH